MNVQPCGIPLVTLASSVHKSWVISQIACVFYSPRKAQFHPETTALKPAVAANTWRLNRVEHSLFLCHKNRKYYVIRVQPIARARISVPCSCTTSTAANQQCFLRRHIVVNAQPVASYEIGITCARIKMASPPLLLPWTHVPQVVCVLVRVLFVRKRSHRFRDNEQQCFTCKVAWCAFMLHCRVFGLQTQSASNRHKQPFRMLSSHWVLDDSVLYPDFQPS